MHIQQEERISGNYRTMIVFLLSCCYLAWLCSTIQPNVFFSGDGGLKYLVTRQINQSGEYSFLQLTQPDWVRQIWQDGFYPFKPPFVYDHSGGKLPAFPPAFSWLSAISYRWFGQAGLYALPVLSLVTCWILFVWVLRRFGMNDRRVAGALFVLVFCSPLTIYAATYWEHTTGVLMLFAGMSFLLLRPASLSIAIVCGLVTGASAWFRPEAILLSVLMVIATIPQMQAGHTRSRICFAISTLVMLIAFFIFNLVIYGRLEGAHGYQLFDDTGVSGWKRITILTHINARLIFFFPVSVMVYGLAVFLAVKRPARNVLLYQFPGVFLLFVLLTPFLLPNAGGKQWGPRYLLPAIPLGLLTLAVAWKYIEVHKNWLGGLLLLAIAGFWMNGYFGSRILQEDYRNRVRPAFDFLLTSAVNVVVVQNQFIAQELAVSFDRKIFFRAETTADLVALEKKLTQRGISQIIYITRDQISAPLPGLINSLPGMPVKKGDYFIAEYRISEVAQTSRSTR